MAPDDQTGLVDVTMPQMGVSVAEGTVVEWKKTVGDTIARDEIICAISTDKIDTDVESPAAGRLQEILVEVGATVEVGTVMARIATEAPQGASTGSAGIGTGEAAAALQAPGDAGELKGDSARTDTSPTSAARESGRPNGTKGYSPVVARMAAEHSIDLSHIQGTGRGGRIRKQDVVAFLEQQSGSTQRESTPEEPPLHIESPYKPEPTENATSGVRSKHVAPQPGGKFLDGTPEVDAEVLSSGPLSRMRQSIGAHMRESLSTAATCTTIAEVDMAQVERLRGKLHTSYLPVIARATVLTLQEFPQLNATLEDDRYTTYKDVNLGVAVSLGEKGLIVPVIHKAQNLSIEGLSSAIKEIARRARANELQPDEVRGATFTITNPGAYGSIMATPIINQPQVAILDTEAVVKRSVVIRDEHGNDAIAIRPMTYLCMAWDHRALDGVLAAQFLGALRQRLEQIDGG